MATDLTTLPPEVTSALMYSGPGPASLVAAASAWNALAAELTSTAQGYETVLTQLASEEWLGPASATMVQAAEPYAVWVTNTAALAEHAATQAQAAAAAFEAAFASIVPPPLVSANRATLAQALQTNFLGLNNGLIAQLETQYAEMWAQNSATLLNYAAASQAASRFTAFSEAPTIVNPAATTTQAAAVGAAQAAPAASIQETLQSLLNQITTSLGQLATPAGTNALVGQLGNSNPILTEIWFLATGQTTLPTNMGSFLTGLQTYANFAYNTEGLPYFSVGMGNSGVQIAKSLGLLSSAAPAAAASVPTPPISAAAGAAGGQVAAGLGSGAHIGHLAVPSSWPGATAAPTVRPAVQMISEPIVAGESTGGNVLSGMPVVGGGSGRGAAVGPRYGFKPTVMPRPMPAG